MFAPPVQLESSTNDHEARLDMYEARLDNIMHEAWLDKHLHLLNLSKQLLSAQCSTSCPFKS